MAQDSVAITNKISKKIHERRRALRMTQAELAKRASVSRSMIATLEAPIREVNASSPALHMIAAALGMTPSEIHDSLAHGFDPAGLPEEQRLLLEKYSKLTEDHKKTIKAMVDFFLATTGTCA